MRSLRRYPLGIAALDAGHLTRAIFALELTVELQPANNLARAELARAYLAAGETANARKALLEARQGSMPAEAAAAIDRVLGAVAQEPVRGKGLVPSRNRALAQREKMGNSDWMCVRRYRKNCDGSGGWGYSCRTIHHALLRIKRSVGHCELFPCRLLDIATRQGQRQQNRGHGLPGRCRLIVFGWRAETRKLNATSAAHPGLLIGKLDAAALALLYPKVIGCWR